MNYLLVIKTTSQGTNDRTLTAYSDDDNALRKFHEAFGVIGGGPKRITAILLRDITRQEAPNLISYDASQLITKQAVEIVRNETWTLQEEENIISEPIINPNPETIDPSTGYPINNG